MPRVLLKTGAITSLAIFILQGCGGPTGRPVNYNKTQGEALADTENCRYQAGIGKGGGGFVFGPLILVAPIAMIMAAENSSKEKAYLDCMRSKGYEIRPVDG